MTMLVSIQRVDSSLPLPKYESTGAVGFDLITREFSRQDAPAAVHSHPMRVIDRTAMAKKYKGKWVALKDDRITVVASGDSAKQVLDIAHKKGVAMPLITRMPRTLRRFIGGA